MSTNAPMVAETPPAEQSMCMACGHPVADHDAIARRYCNATIEHATTRGCICAVSPA
jgi:hypothetical protein